MNSVNRIKSLTPCMAILLAATLPGSINLQADVVATVEVPNGTTNFPGFVLWSLNDPGEPSTFFEFEVSPGLNANNIALGMDIEVDNAFGFEGMLAGNVLTIEDAIGNLGTAPAEVEINWDVTLPPGPGVDVPDFPYTNAPRPVDYQLLSLFIAGPDGNPVPVNGGSFQLDLFVLANSGHTVSESIEFDIPFGASTQLVNLLIDTQLQHNQSSELQYVGLNQGFPSFQAPSGFGRFSIRTGIRSSAPQIVQLGYILQPPILMGDINCDGEVNLLDVAPFVELLTSGGYLDKADFNDDGILSLLDVSGFIDALAG